MKSLLYSTILTVFLLSSCSLFNKNNKPYALKLEYNLSIDTSTGLLVADLLGYEVLQQKVKKENRDAKNGDISCRVYNKESKMVFERSLLNPMISTIETVNSSGIHTIIPVKVTNKRVWFIVPIDKNTERIQLHWIQDGEGKTHMMHEWEIQPKKLMRSYEAGSE